MIDERIEEEELFAILIQKKKKGVGDGKRGEEGGRRRWEENGPDIDAHFGRNLGEMSVQLIKQI